MITIPIELILSLILVLLAALCVFTFYLIIERRRENRRVLAVANYLERNRTDWYNYLRKSDSPKKNLLPQNAFEATAVEELFRSLIHNVRENDIEQKVSDFANEYLADYYRKNLKGRNWGKRMNALHRIHDFHINVLAEECQTLSKRNTSSEENFLYLLIDLKFRPDNFIEEHSQELDYLNENDVKELLFSMPEHLFQEIMNHIQTLSSKVQYALVEVIGMKLDAKCVSELEQMFLVGDSELRIRVMRVFNTLSILPALSILNASLLSDVWQERYQAVRLLRWLPKKEANQYAKQMINDDYELIQKEAQLYIAKQSADHLSYSQAAADVEHHEFPPSIDHSPHSVELPNTDEEGKGADRQ